MNHDDKMGDTGPIPRIFCSFIWVFALLMTTGCGTAFANICPELMPEEDRGIIGSIKPSGWHTVNYHDLIDGNYLYNRCHLISYALAGENDEERNLITGTRYLNTKGMISLENRVANYVRTTGNHVLYRVTPIFEGENLVASGVVMEAESVEDRGEGVRFHVYAFNVQPGIEIMYSDGESRAEDKTVGSQKLLVLDDSNQNADGITRGPQDPGIEAAAAVDTGLNQREAVVDDSLTEVSYILNRNSKKFHYPKCSSVGDMREKNKEYSNASREEIISRGFEPCRRCNP